jgi:drug/metabolite transporter (DMT)-like permease
VREGNPFVSVWLVLATICFFPTFIITNKVFLMGGRMSLFVPVTATAYFLSMLVGRFGFGEPVSWQKWFGCSLILSGVMAIARG